MQGSLDLESEVGNYLSDPKNPRIVSFSHFLEASLFSKNKPRDSSDPELGVEN